MERINRNNYEAFFLDYMEGNLSEEYRSEFQAFLINNPDLAEELEVADMPVLETDASGSPDFKHLKVTVTDEILVGIVEGDFSGKEKDDLLNQIMSSPARFELDLLSKTKLVPDTAVTFDQKHSLKKKSPVVRTLFFSTAAAAAILLMLFLLPGNPAYQPREEASFAELSNDKSFTEDDFSEELNQLVGNHTIPKDVEISQPLEGNRNQTPKVHPIEKQELTEKEFLALEVIPVKSIQLLQAKQPLARIQYPSDDVELLAAISVPSRSSHEEYLTPVQFFRSMLGGSPDDSQGVNKSDFITLAAAGYTKITGEKASVSSGKDSRVFSVVAGNFELTRVKSEKK